MKKILFIFLTAIALAACSDTRDIAPAMGCVTVVLSKRAADPQIVTRTVDNDLQVDVLNEAGEVLHHYGEGQAYDALQNLMLEAGTYTLRAYTANHDAEYADAERGEAKYYGETTFSVQAGRHIRLGLEVPMTNIAVSFSVDEQIASRFTSIRFTVSRGDRTQHLLSGETAWFDLDPADADLNYELTMTNADSETCSQSKYLKAADQRAGTHYIITYRMGRLMVREKSK